MAQNDHSENTHHAEAKSNDGTKDGSNPLLDAAHELPAVNEADVPNPYRPSVLPPSLQPTPPIMPADFALPDGTLPNLQITDLSKDWVKPVPVPLAPPQLPPAVDNPPPPKDWVPPVPDSPGTHPERQQKLAPELPRPKPPVGHPPSRDDIEI